MFEQYKEIMHSFMTEFEYPIEAQAEIENAYIKAFENPKFLQELDNLLQIYQKDCNQGFEQAPALCNQAAGPGKISVFSVYMAVWILLASIAKKHYLAQGFSVEMWKANFTDLRYKLHECKLVKGVWGTFVPTWYNRFFNVSRFTFGKLQFETESLPCDYEKGDVKLEKGIVAINMHIPRTGTHLSPQDVEDACTAAAAFFKEKYGMDQTVFICHSWLLYPENKKMLKPTSNLYHFISLFDIVSTEEYADYTEVWRLFDKDYTEDLTQMPADTSLRRAYIERMRRGEKTGCGYGIYIP